MTPACCRCLTRALDKYAFERSQQVNGHCTWNDSHSTSPSTHAQPQCATHGPKVTVAWPTAPRAGRHHRREDHGEISPGTFGHTEGKCLLDAEAMVHTAMMHVRNGRPFTHQHLHPFVRRQATWATPGSAVFLSDREDEEFGTVDLRC